MHGGLAHLLGRYGLSFDLQLYASQMATAAALADDHPDIPLVVNHAGMPTDRDEAGLAAWREGLATLAERPNVSCKISGLAMVDRAWTPASLRPFVLRVKRAPQADCSDGMSDRRYAWSATLIS